MPRLCLISYPKLRPIRHATLHRHDTRRNHHCQKRKHYQDIDHSVLLVRSGRSAAKPFGPRTSITHSSSSPAQHPQQQHPPPAIRTVTRRTRMLVMSSGGMTYAEAVEHLHALGPELPPSTDPSIPRRKFDLAHMRRLCAALGDPHLRVPSVLIAGTNGKGSTAATLGLHPHRRRLPHRPLHQPAPRPHQRAYPALAPHPAQRIRLSCSPRQRRPIDALRDPRRRLCPPLRPRR